MRTSELEKSRNLRKKENKLKKLQKMILIITRLENTERKLISFENDAIFRDLYFKFFTSISVKPKEINQL
jgi:hypothetical protein